MELALASPHGGPIRPEDRVEYGVWHDYHKITNLFKSLKLTGIKNFLI